MDIQLFLAHADDHEPVLADGIPMSAAQEAPMPAGAAARSGRYVGFAPPDALPEQGFAIVAPKGPTGDRLLRLIEPLRQWRAEQQAEEVLVYRIDPGMDLGAATAWIQHDYWDMADRREERLPRYLLLLGGADVVSWDLQQLLAGDAFVGRLAFPDDRGYEAYAEKVLRWEQREDPAPGARALLYTVRDGTSATSLGYRHLMGPSLEIARERRQRGLFPATDVVEIGGGEDLPSGDGLVAVEQMLREAAQARAGVLFSMSHGAGVPRVGWRSPAEQRAHQGAMVLGRSRDRLTASDVEERSFLPGGVWLSLACYGAGTPVRSAYHPWLERLNELGWEGASRRVLAALPRAGEPPFVAALPQAALANPNGPLGVVGHVDLAWSWSFLDCDPSSASAAVRARPERFQGILRAFVEGHRLGVGHHEVARFFRQLSMQLSTLYDESAQLGISIDSDAEDHARKMRRAALWMQRQDLCAYVLLGDPAARLPIARYPAGVEGKGR